MHQEEHVFTESFKIRSSEVRPDGKAKLQTLCDLLQEIAGNHALALNFDVTQLNNNGLTWMLHRLNIQVKKYPGWRETVTVKTWPSGGDKLRAYRDFLVLDEEGNTLLKAISYWLMIDLNNRRPVRMPQEVLDLAPDNVEHALPLKSPRLNSPTNIETNKVFSVRYSDLDVNRHVNNVIYVEWMTETLPANRLVKKLQIEFKAECGYGERVMVNTSSKKNGYLSEVSMADGGKTLATANMQLF